jgi:hypothetical protein
VPTSSDDAGQLEQELDGLVVTASLSLYRKPLAWRTSHDDVDPAFREVRDGLCVEVAYISLEHSGIGMV